MNRHKAYWSVMGNEVSTEKSERTKDFEKLEKQLTIMLNMYDKTDVLTCVRNVYTNLESED